MLLVQFGDFALHFFFHFKGDAFRGYLILCKLNYAILIILWRWSTWLKMLMFGYAFTELFLLVYLMCCLPSLSAISNILHFFRIKNDLIYYNLLLLQYLFFSLIIVLISYVLFCSSVACNFRMLLYWIWRNFGVRGISITAEAHNLLCFWCCNHLESDMGNG